MLPPSNPFAFPRGATEFGGCVYQPQDGMELRDYFAGQALVGMLMQQTNINALKSIVEGIGQDVHAAISRVAYEYADAMLAAREKART